MNYSLNHVWIQAVRLQKQDALSCPIPDALIENTRINAAANIGVPVNIWVDLCGVGETDSDVITMLNAQESAPNITYRSLDEITRYKTDPLFKIKPQDQEKIIWEQVDVARLLVLEHMLDSSKEAAIYSDMDMNLQDSRFHKALGILEEFGAVVMELHDHGGLENGFFGFKQSKKAFLSEELLDAEAEKPTGLTTYYDIFYAAFEGRTEQYGFSLDEVSTPVLQLENAALIKQNYQSADLH